MPPVFTCCVVNCDADAKNTRKHRFPKDLVLLRKWIEFSQRTNLENMDVEKVRNNYRICDYHFAPEYMVGKVHFDDDIGYIKGEIQASMKNKFYKVEIFLKENDIERCTCNCPRGLDECHHMVALALFSHYNISPTDKACTWLKKKGTEEVLTAEKCFPRPSTSYSSLAEEIDETLVKSFYEELLLCGPTSKVHFDDDIGYIKGEIQASMKNKFYKVEIFLKENDIERCTCNCPRGLDECHHMVALALFSHYNISPTDKACTWLKKKGTEEVLTAEKCFPRPSTSYSSLAEEIDETLVKSFYEELLLCGPTSMQWFMSPEPCTTIEMVVDIQELLFSTDYNKSKNKSEFLIYSVICLKLLRLKK
ncbi:hypothetical protein FQR65_LT18888 [Abscondita terminalis]|nr:hypothetical protein FQR65_LT18888 [Abscondita terminalis]